MRLRCWPLLLLLSTAAWAAPSPQPARLRVYFIGNSVTDTVNYRALAQLAASRGVEQVWGRHMIPGAPLYGMWESQHGFVEQPYGYAREALTNHPWDAVTVQPFDRHIRMRPGGDLPESQGDLYVINEMLKAGRAQNPDVQFYLYARWPRMYQGGKPRPYDKNDYDPNQPGGGVDWRTLDDWRTLWSRKYTGGWDGTNETRDYFDQLLKAVAEANPDLPRPVRILPVGDVMAALETKMRTGGVPGYESVWQLYKDGIHLNPYGSYLVGVTFLATLYGQDPVGLPSTPYGELQPEVVRVIQETVRDVVAAERAKWPNSAGITSVAPTDAPLARP